MAIFKRRKNQTVAELEEFYASKQTRTGRAWVMAVISLLITVLVASALFFGGRWIYLSLTDDATKDTISDNGGTDTKVVETGVSGSESEDGYTFPSVVSDEAASTSTPSNSSPTTSTPTTKPSATSTPSVASDLPDTGAGETSFIFMFITFMVGYYIKLKKQKANS